MGEIEAKSVAERYVAMWNEPDPALRSGAVREMWAVDGSHVVRVPEEMREAAAAVGFVVPGLVAAGYDALEFRVARAYDEFVGPGAYLFRPRDDAERLHDVVKFSWEMVSCADQSVAATGLEVLVLDADGRVARDYQFVG